MGLTYRYGFMCHHVEDAPARHGRWARIHNGWPQRRVEDFVFHLNDEARLETHSRPEGVVAIVGDVYAQYGKTVAEVVTEMPWDDPWPSLDALGGRFAILLLSGSEMRVAHDAFGSRTLYYKPGMRAVASHALLLAKVHGIAPDPEVSGFLEMPEYLNRKISYLPGDLSTQTGIFQLIPNNYYDGARTRRYWPRGPVPATTAEEFYAEADRYFAAFVPFVRSRYIPVFGVTGGIDSRTAFAAFGSDFLGVTWLSHMKSVERPVIQQIVAQLGLKHDFLDIRKLSRGRVADAAQANTGNLRPGHRVTEGMAVAYDAKHCFIRGYGGEIMRGFPAYGKRLEVFTAREMTRAYSTSMRRTPISEAYLAFCDRAFDGFRDRAHYDGIEAFGLKNMDLFYWEHRMGMWGANMLNEMDPACMSLVAFNSRPLYAASFGLQDEQRLSKELLATYARRHNAKLAEIEYL